MISERWKCYLVVLEQIYRVRNAFGWVKKTIQKCCIDFWLVWTRFAWSGLTYVPVGIWYVSGGSSELEILKIFYFSSTSVEPKIYLYLVDFNFFYFLKSYESEKLENEDYVLREHDLPPSPEKTWSVFSQKPRLDPQIWCAPPHPWQAADFCWPLLL